MTTVRDRLWLWGHEAGSHNPATEHYQLPGASRMTPVEAAFYMDIPNMIMVRYRDEPTMPFDQYALAMRPLQQVFWSIVGGGGRSSEAERAHVLELAKQTPNITGVFMDDFFNRSSDEENAGVLPVADIRALRDKLVMDDRRLDLGVVVYTHQLDMPIQPYLQLCDWVSFWTWEAPELKNLEQNFSTFEELAPDSRKLLGLYMWDYGLKQPMPVDAMERQATTALEWLHKGRIDGMIFLASCICDLELPAVEWSREWIQKVGHEQLG